MQLAIDDAGLTADDIGHVNAHGTSTALNDSAEAEAIRKVFGDSCPPVTSTKGVTGHLVGAAGAVEAIVALQAGRDGLVPPTANHDRLGDDIAGSTWSRASPARSRWHRCSRTRSASAGTTPRWCWSPHA